jgi:RimJ/RimL family protein N-acetyltransferase
MSAFVTLSSGRICLRRWRDEDREAFAAMNSDARVMEFFRSRLSRVESDGMIDGIQRHFSEREFGLWAIEVPGVAPFIGFAGLTVARFGAPFTPCVEVGWRIASSIGDAVMQRRRPDWRLATGLGFSHSQKSCLSHPR